MKLNAETKITAAFALSLLTLGTFSFYTFVEISSPGKKIATDAVFSFMLLVLSIVIILCTVYILFKKELLYNKKSKEQLRRMNKELERSVKVRTDALIASEKKYRLVADNATDVITLYNIEGTCTYISGSVKSSSGYDPSEVVGKSGYHFVHPDDVARVQEAHIQLLSGVPYNDVIPFRFLKKNGEYMHAEALAAIVYDANHKMESIILCTRDVSDRVKAEDELHQQQQMLQGLMKNSIDPIWSVNKDLTLLDFNASCSYMTNYFYKKEVSAGMNALLMSDDESREEWKECYMRTLSGEYFSKEIKLRSRLEDHYYEVSFNPIILNDQVNGIAVFARDITAHKKIENQLSYKVNELNSFMYKATHDLRSPLVSLMGLVQLAEDETTENITLKQYFDMIGKSVSKMDKLLVDLVSITNVSQGKLSLGRIDFNKMTGDIIESLSHYPNFNHISMTINIDEDIELYTDDKLLYSVMQNLIDNAIKYSKPGGDSSVEIVVSSSENGVKISISDNGIGIPEMAREKVFDMFYRASTTASGTGLGLYIVKSAVVKMSGKISLSSSEAGGTQMQVTLPNLYQMEKVA